MVYQLTNKLRAYNNSKYYPDVLTNYCLEMSHVLLWVNK